MKLTKEQYDELPDGMKALFKADGDGYISTFATAEEVQGLKDNNAALIAEKKTATDKETAAQKAAREAQEKIDRQNGDISALDKSWTEKLTAAETAAADREARYIASLTKSTVGAAATELATKLFGVNAGIMKGHVSARLTMEEKDGKFVVRVLGKDGKPSAMTTDELYKEFTANKEFAPVLVGSGSGGGPRTPTTTVDPKPGGFTNSADALRAEALKLMESDD